MSVKREHPYDSIQRWVETLPEQKQTILRSSFSNPQLRCPPPAEIAAQMGLPIDRLRNQKRSALQSFRKFLDNTDEGKSINKIVERVAKTISKAPALPFERISKALPASREGKDDIPGLIVYMAARGGDYLLHDDGWLILKQAASSDPTKALVESADSYGRIPAGSISELYKQWGLPAKDRIPYLLRNEYVVMFEGEPLATKNSQKLIALTLAHHGEPMEPADLHQMLIENFQWSRSYRHMLNLLYGKEQFVRVAKKDWALREWDMPEYRSGSRSIANVIEDAGGEISHNDLLEQMRKQFGARAGTVSTYIRHAPAFVLENGNVRMRRNDEPYVYEIPECGNPGVYHLPDKKISILVGVDAHSLRGSGSRCQPEIASAISLEPGSTITISGEEGEITVSYPLMAGSPSLSTLRQFIEKHDCREGDYLSFTVAPPDRLLGLRVIRKEEAESPEWNSWETVARLTGIKAEDGLEGLAESLGCEPSAVRETVKRRRDKPLGAIIAELV